MKRRQTLEVLALDVRRSKWKIRVLRLPAFGLHSRRDSRLLNVRAERAKSRANASIER